jgi:SpoVK/Ycf46/Vps4 family AAA+-type ATPase
VKKSGGGWTVDGKKYGLPLLKGILMVGLPGAGKSLSAKALGREWNLPVIDFDPSRVFSSRVGDSETNMRRALQIIDNMAPAILMIDEIEKGLAGLQSSSFSDSGVTARVIRSFLVWMQENTKPVFTVATANSIVALPPEMISRFDEVFFVNLPQLLERKDILRIHIKKLGRDPEKFNLDILAGKSQDLSGREIEQALREAMYDSFHNNVDLSQVSIEDALARKTSLITTMAEQLKAIIKWVGWDEVKGDGQRARYASTPEAGNIQRIRSEIDSLIKDVELGKLDQGSGGSCP